MSTIRSSDIAFTMGMKSRKSVANPVKSRFAKKNSKISTHLLTVLQSVLLFLADKKNKVICYLSIDFYILGQNNYQAVNVAADVNNNGNLTERGRLYEHQ